MNKLKTWDEIRGIVIQSRNDHKKVVFTNGCFDILHAGHVHYLEEARGLGDLLIVGLNSDSSVRRIKGKSRPINNQEDRAVVLGALCMVDYIVIFEQDNPYELISLIQPDILVKGGDWSPENIIGGDLVISRGGQIKSIPIRTSISTSDIIAKIRCDDDGI
ncbi:MAG: D-glycero-beta-D-manno-heptose 1-phosphate adenylyltransferase [Candidatus Cloacimonetes bacterium]|nr:D-glycero-beta-D-manno-heptose 1-phosphate adenylyltransferase [Candidatus Cloacimonadota bacterium]